jgi:hypothetical protein
MTVRQFLVVAVVAAALPSAVLAQDGQATFWLKGSANNIQGCMSFDPQFTRKHIFTLKDGQAEVTSAGGINLKLSPVRAEVYETRIQMGGLNMLVTADLAATPKTLTVKDTNMGCAWSAVKE